MERLTFRRGDAVPSHVLDLEPVGPSGPRPKVVFEADCDILDLGEKYVVLTHAPGNDYSIRVDAREGTGKMAVFAPTKPVWIMTTWTSLEVPVSA